MTQERDLADFLREATDEEIFEKMQELELQTESGRFAELSSLVALVETEIEQRFPGQSLAPYMRWKQNRLL